MNDDMANLMNQFKNMVDNDTVPDQVKDLLNQMNSSHAQTTNNAESTQNTTIPSISPDAISNLMSMLNSSKSSQNTDQADDTSQSIPNIDMDMLLKMKSIMEKMNTKNDPSSNLLQSLKPYLRESRKGKVEQYMQLFNMTKIMGVFGKPGDSKK